MPTFRFTARDRDGVTRSGEIDADGAEQAAARLEMRGLRVEEVRPSASGMPAVPMSGHDASAFAGQLAGLVDAGLPLPTGLRALGEELPTGALRRAFEDVARRLEAGAMLEEAVAAQERRLPGHLRGLVLAGVRTGRLGEVLGRFVDATRAGGEIRRRVVLALAYPAVLLVAACILFVFACFSVVEGFRSIFQGFGIPVPVITRAVFQISYAVTKLNWRALPALAGVVAACWLAERLLLSPARRRQLACEVPLFGKLLRWSALAEFSRLLGLLIVGEIPLPEALTLAGDAVRDADLAVAGRSIAREVEEGRSLSEALARRRQFPRGYARLVGWAEGHRSLPEALEVLGAMYEARAKAHASFLGAVVGALVMIAVLGGISLAVVALMWPLMYLMHSLSG